MTNTPANVVSTKIVRSYRRTLTMRVLPDQTLVIRAPFFLPKIMIDKFIAKHRDWVEKQVEKAKTFKPTGRNYIDGEKFLFLGKEVNLKLGNYQSIGLKGESILFPQVAHFRIEKELSTWYIKNATKIISQQVKKYAAEMGTSYGEISFSDTKSKWGSCTHDNRLQFNWRLVMAPVMVINYVVVHELVHTIEKNHSRMFWSKVRLYNPSYKQQIKWLKLHASKLTL